MTRKKAKKHPTFVDMAISTDLIIRCNNMYQLVASWVSHIWICTFNRTQKRVWTQGASEHYRCIIISFFLATTNLPYDWLEMQLVHDVTPNYRVSANRHINKSWVFLAFSQSQLGSIIFEKKQASLCFFLFHLSF